MKEVRINKKTYSLKSNYLELKKDEFLKIAFLRAQYLNEIEREKYEALRLQAFYVLCSAPLSKLKLLNAVQLTDCVKHVDWVFEEVPKYSINPLPYFKVRFTKKFYASPGLFSQSSIEEIADADSAFVSASNSKAIDKMYLLAAILYRPERKDLAEHKKSFAYNGDVREPYNSQRIRETVPMLKKWLPFYYVVAIYLAYWSFREHHIVKEPVIKILFEGSEKNEGLNLNWLGTLLEVSDGKFGNWDETIRQNWKLVLYEIARELDQSKQRLKRQEEAAIRNKFT